mgnify:CR=1 FL=1
MKESVPQDAPASPADVRAHTPIDADHARVEFVARSKAPGMAAVRLHERSRFVCEQGQWLYVEAI